MAEGTSASVKAEPAQNVTNDVEKTEPKLESATPQKPENINATSPQSTKAEIASPQGNDNNPSNPTGPARKPSRPPPKLSIATENHVRETMNKARKVVNGKDNPIKSEEDIKELALLATNLIQLLNASFIATDTIVRGVAYMRGESQASPQTAIIQAKRDRRAQKAAEQPLGNTTNDASPENDARAANTAANDAKGTEAGLDTGSSKENVAPGTEGQQQNESHQGKSNKKKRFWNNRRRSFRNRKTSANVKVQENKVNGTNAEVDGTAEAKDHVNDKGSVTGHKPETSGSDTAVEETVVEGDGVVVAVKV